MSDTYPEFLDAAFERFYAAFQPYFRRWTTWLNVMKTFAMYGLDTPPKPQTVDELIAVGRRVRTKLLPLREESKRRNAELPHVRYVRDADGRSVPRAGHEPISEQQSRLERVAGSHSRPSCTGVCWGVFMRRGSRCHSVYAAT